MAEYSIPTVPIESTYEIKNSTFIVSVRHICSMDQMKIFVKEMREKHPKANHNCWAVITGAPSDSNSYGFSDDGEPNGTAGKPIFTVLQHSGIGQIGVVVTRYFGGIKLGTGGLVKAYTAAAKTGIDSAQFTSYSPMQIVRITIPYSREPHLRYLLDQSSLTAEFSYDHGVTVHLSVREDSCSSFIRLLEESLGTDAGISLI